MNVVFDFGGVLFRWQPEAFMPRLLPGRGLDAAALRRLIDDFFEGFDGDWGRFDAGTIEAAELAPLIAARTGIDVADVQRVIAAIPAELQPVPATVALVDGLRRRSHRLYFLSNMPASYAVSLAAANPLDTWFEGGLYSSHLQLRKPDRAIYAALASRFDLDPAASLFIDDTARNIEAARALGWQTLLFSNPAQCRAALAERGLL